MIIKMKMSRATHSLLKAIKVGITVFFKTQKNGKKRLIKKKKKQAEQPTFGKSMLQAQRKLKDVNI